MTLGKPLLALRQWHRLDELVDVEAAIADRGEHRAQWAAVEPNFSGPVANLPVVDQLLSCEVAGPLKPVPVLGRMVSREDNGRLAR